MKLSRALSSSWSYPATQLPTISRTVSTGLTLGVSVSHSGVSECVTLRDLVSGAMSVLLFPMLAACKQVRKLLPLLQGNPWHLEKKNVSLVSNKFLGYGFAYGAVPQRQSLKKAQPGQILVVFSLQQSKDISDFIMLSKEVQEPSRISLHEIQVTGVSERMHCASLQPRFR